MVSQQLRRFKKSPFTVRVASSGFVGRALQRAIERRIASVIWGIDIGAEVDKSFRNFAVIVSVM